MNVARTVRSYAKDAHKRYATELDQMRERINERPGDFTGDRFVTYAAARALYNLYAEPLALDADGNSPFDDEKVIDRITDTRRTQLKWLLTNKLDMSGIEIVMQQIGENAARKFLSNTEFVGLEDEEPETLGEWPAMGAVILVQDMPTTDAQRELWGKRRPPSRKGEVVESPADGSTFLTIDVGGEYGGVTYASRDFPARYTWKEASK